VGGWLTHSRTYTLGVCVCVCVCVCVHVLEEKPRQGGWVGGSATAPLTVRWEKCWNRKGVGARRFLPPG
jgi:hypothetical protein